MAAVEAYLRDAVRGSFPILPYDEAAATWHGEERARLETLGRPVPFVDRQIAAIAHVHWLVLVTTKRERLRALQGAGNRNWSRHHRP